MNELNVNEEEVTKAGLNRALLHLTKYENMSTHELMEVLGVLTNDRKLAAVVQSLWKVLVCEIKLKLHDDIKNLILFQEQNLKKN